MLQGIFFIVIVGLPGIEPGLRAPHARVLPIYYSPLLSIKKKCLSSLAKFETKEKGASFHEAAPVLLVGVAD